MASAADIATFRRRIGDRVKTEQDTIVTKAGDKIFRLRFTNVFDVVVAVDSVTQASDGSVYTVDSENGRIDFVTAPGTDKTVVVDYDYAAYTDAEATSLIDTYGIKDAVIEAILELLANAARLYNYSQGQTKSERGKVFDNLKELLKLYQSNGGFTSADGTNIGSVSIGKRTNEYDRGVGTTEYDLSRLDSWES